VARRIPLIISDGNHSNGGNAKENVGNKELHRETRAFIKLINHQLVKKKFRFL